MLIGPLTKEAIDSVFSSLSEQSAKEIRILGKTTAEVKKRFMEMQSAPFTAALHDKDGRAMALIALEPSGFKTWVGNLVSAENAWKTMGLAMCHFFARFSDDFVERSKGTIEAYSPCDYGKWFDYMTAIGFHLEGKADNGCFRYVKKER